MSKKVVILIAAACLAAGLGLGFLLRREGPLKIDINRPNASSIDARPESVPRAVSRTYTEETSSYLVDVEYPELQDMADARVQAKVNDRIKADVFGHVASFHAQSPSGPELGDVRSMLSANYRVALLTNSFFSGMLAYSNYTAGAAHPNNYLAALNYDLRTGSAVTLEQFVKVLKPSSGWFDRLAGYVIDDLVRQLGGDPDQVGAINEGAAAAEANYRNFTLDESGLNIHFDPYQVAAYAVGSPEVKIPYDVLLSQILRSPSAGTAATGTARWWLE